MNTRNKRFDEGTKLPFIAPERYSDAADALESLLISVQLRAGSLSSYAVREMINPIAAAEAIQNERDALPLDSVSFWCLYQERHDLIYANSNEREKIVKCLIHWGKLNWIRIAEKVEDLALKHFKDRYRSHNFKELLNEWPELKSQPNLLTNAIKALESREVDPETCLDNLALLPGNQEHATRVLAAICGIHSGYRIHSTFKAHDELAKLIDAWVPSSIWGTFHSQLLHRGSDSSESIPGIAAEPIRRVVQLIREFGILAIEDESYALADLSPESRAAWRHELARVVGENKDLKLVVSEALMIYGEPRSDRAVLFAVSEMHRDDLEGSLAPLINHPSSLVRRRVTALISMINSRSDTLALLPDAQQSAKKVVWTSSAQTLPRTWLGDVRVEHLIELALNESASSAAADISNSLASGEETHVAILFERMRSAMERISKEFAAYAAENNSIDCISLNMSHRLVGKKEEGASGVGTGTFSADICILFEAKDRGITFAKRASFIQAKRLYIDKSAAKADYYPFSKKQLEDLSKQTSSSFLLLLGPVNHGVTIPLISAKLMLDLIERGEPSAHISPLRAADLGKNIGSWILEDVVGMWTGDWTKKIINKAEGGKNNKPIMLVNLSVDRVRLDQGR